LLGLSQVGFEDQALSTKEAELKETKADTIEMAPEVEAPTVSAIRPTLDLDAVRAKLAGKQGPKYWRGLEEIAETEEFSNWVEDEFPNRATLLQMDRRTLLKFMGASMALAGLSGCRGAFLDEEKIVPYVKQPEEIVPGKPLFFATAIPYSGYGVGVLVESREGRPIKIEGNPGHPDSRGATTSMMQAEILNFYDPDRSQSVTNLGEISTWDVFLSDARKVLAEQKARAGSGLRILTETIASPTLAEQIKGLLKTYPGAKWYQFDPCGPHSAKAAAVAAFGRPVNTIYNIKKAKVIVSLDSDFLMEGPGNLTYARDFADGRRVMGDNADMNRLYAIESYPTITGATADHRFRVRGSEIEAFGQALYAALGQPAVFGDKLTNIDGISQANIEAIARDLMANRGAALVIPGEHQSPGVHVLCHAINSAIGALGSTAMLTPTLDDSGQSQVAGLKELTDDLNGKRVDALLIIGGNPVYNAPVDFQFDRAIQNCPFTVHHAQYNDETSEKCTWHLPLAHFLEQWSDVRAYDGTISIVQPLIAPLFDSRSAHQLLGMLTGQGEDGHALLMSAYKSRAVPTAVDLNSDVAAGKAFDKKWRRALNDGVMPATNYSPLSLPFIAASLNSFPPQQSIKGIELIIKADPTVHDGRYANNGWQQEIAKPLTKITWENALIMSPKTAQSLGVVSEDGMEVRVQSRSATGPVWILPGHPENSITVHLGYGRTRSGAVGNGIGFNAYQLRRSDAMSFAAAEATAKVGAGSHPIASTQIHHTMEGRDIVRVGTMVAYKENKSLHEHEEVPVNQVRPEMTEESTSLYPDEIFNYDGPQWGMTVDLNTCIGCNACVTACQAENNISVVGKDQVKRGREMQWIRIDRYFANEAERWDKGDFNASPAADPLANPDYVFQPMLCQHCEKAPCEPVCPVGATMHSHEGLNQMVYNRCVGTRYCSNNCPYKVRRFNYLNFSDNQAQFRAGDEENATRVPLLRLLNNPDVTVRGRGVMEKCTFCVQRINDVRIEAKKQGRDPKDGEIQVACQQACPTRTIVFGNVADKESEVSKIRNDPRAYQVLRELQTRPRVSYLGKIRNTNPEIRA
jgi:MoCo/4Fe-4S cofactor protein with predicted Tat translocation signal